MLQAPDLEPRRPSTDHLLERAHRRLGPRRPTESSDVASASSSRSGLAAAAESGTDVSANEAQYLAMVDQLKAEKAQLAAKLRVARHRAKEAAKRPTPRPAAAIAAAASAAVARRPSPPQLGPAAPAPGSIAAAAALFDRRRSSQAPVAAPDSASAAPAAEVRVWSTPTPSASSTGDGRPAEAAGASGPQLPRSPCKEVRRLEGPRAQFSAACSPSPSVESRSRRSGRLSCHLLARRPRLPGGRTTRVYGRGSTPGPA